MSVFSDIALPQRADYSLKNWIFRDQRCTILNCSRPDHSIVQLDPARKALHGPERVHVKRDRLEPLDALDQIEQLASKAHLALLNEPNGLS
jgi:hypothetical protein